MSPLSHTDVICRKFCKFYKEDKQVMQCGTYRFLSSLVTAPGLEGLVGNVSLIPDFSFDERIANQICSRCSFLIDGCDFRAGLASPPCGGYPIVEYLLRTGRITLGEGS